MKLNDRHQMANHAANQINGTTFYEKNNHENEITSVELASEFGVSLESIKKVKRKLDRF
ncbi:hypothetical protein [Heyndrickxia ginsengihumi]|uniref:hypothetical protein n=1 Tax=Heyndrickxia ginsengihumi TaxID=363870 RepID=UPI0004B3D369|nr:hypothetical protein [Heyndrickxia ginsengihumi]